MEIERYFTREHAGKVFDIFKWKKVDVVIKNDKTGEVLYEGRDLEFPESYNQNACDIIAKMYFKKSDVPGTGSETSMKQVADRMINFWVLSMLDEGLITEEQRDIVYDELMYSLLNQMWAPNSPQWFNTGLFHSYGIEGQPSGHFYYDPNYVDKDDPKTQIPGKVIEAPNGFERTQGSACFIVNVNDSLVGDQSLMDNLTVASRLFKYGSGVGQNWSKIRGVGEKLSGGGMSSGLISFLKVHDRNAGAIKSGGASRRASVMNVLDVDHPEIFEYVQWKAREEDKVVALGRMGYDTSMTGEAYDTVSGANVNNSVSIPDKFMQSVERNENTKWLNDKKICKREVGCPVGDHKYPMWDLKGRVDSSVDRVVSSWELWEEIAWAAWRCGDPGVQFTDTINKWHTCPNDGRIESSNPCSEYLFLNDTSCNLASINVLKFYQSDYQQFNIMGYLHLIFLIQLVLEATIHWGYFPTKQIAEQTYNYRATGLGITNLGALLMMHGVPYDSDEARTIGAALCSLLTAQSYTTSALMAKQIGPFKKYKDNESSMLNVIKMHQDHWKSWGFKDRIEINHQYIKEVFFKSDNDRYGRICKIWDDVMDLGSEYGFRNAQVTCIAPTGTIAFAMDCDSTSIEPFFSHLAYKKISDGSFMTIVNKVVSHFLLSKGYTLEQIQDIEEYVLEKGTLEWAPHLIESHLPIFDTASKSGDGGRYITPEAHVKMVAAIQPHVSGGISKTVNLPESATVEDIKNIYFLAWTLGCKCIALYRDKCKVVQPLTAKRDSLEDTDSLDNMTYHNLLEYTKNLLVHLQYGIQRGIRPFGITNQNDRVRTTNEVRINRKELPYEPTCTKNEVEMDSQTFHIIRSFYEDGTLGEIFVTAAKQGSTVKGMLEVLSMVISKALQYGVPAETISRTLRNHEFGPNGLVLHHPYIKSAMSIPDLMSKFIDISNGNYTYCQVKPDQKELNDSTNKVLQDSLVKGSRSITKDHVMDTEPEVLYGESCHSCGSSKMIKAGTCKYCQSCGASTGCS